MSGVEHRIVKRLNGYEIERWDNGLIVWWEVWNAAKLDFQSFRLRREAYSYCREAGD